MFGALWNRNWLFGANVKLSILIMKLQAYSVLAEFLCPSLPGCSSKIVHSCGQRDMATTACNQHYTGKFLLMLGLTKKLGLEVGLPHSHCRPSPLYPLTSGHGLDSVIEGREQ